MAQAENFQCQESVSGTALGRFGAAGFWLSSTPEAAGEVPPGDSALPVTAMRQGAGPRVVRGRAQRRGWSSPAWPDPEAQAGASGRTATRARPARGCGRRAHPVPYLA